MDKIDEMSHAYTLGDPYVVSVEDIDDEAEQLAAENTDDSNHGEKGGAPLREQDRFLPIANVAKIMKKAIPDSGKVNNKIAKDARECVQECVSEFISFITSEASDRCHLEKRKTINGEDILFAMSSLGFDNYVEPLKLYLQKYREAVKVDKNLHQ
uniref:Nuclear transcription factor Y subunit beta n=2 Tax=Dendroctonus ponderosae TaxID=77166 RepID=J3JWI3_DENPD|nr:unknown [Dendroctonus ponderosae]